MSPASVVPNSGLRSSEALTSTVPVSPAIARLRSYNIDPAKVFIAGISSGGFFGVQMDVAHSATFKGAAIYAGGVYYCALDNVATALVACGGEGLYQSTLAESEAYMDLQSSKGTIDSERNLRRQPIYLWSGTADTVVKQAEMNDLQTEYEHYGANVFKYDNAFPAEHGWESPDGSLPCGTAAEPYMIACDIGNRPYDSERTWLSEFFGPLRARNDGRLQGQLVHFDQTEFGAGATNSMDTNGYAFVPRDCAQNRRCGLVVAFHGCLQTQADIGTAFVTESGIDEWADDNGIIVLYPYAIKSSTVPYNPQGCWDWWGYDNAGTDTAYSTKNGVQIGIVYKMVERVTGR
jgi:poly(3-hydroxybutyrate) depolymerase